MDLSALSIIIADLDGMKKLRAMAPMALYNTVSGQLLVEMNSRGVVSQRIPLRIIVLFRPYLSEKCPPTIIIIVDRAFPIKSAKLTSKTEAFRLLMKSGMKTPAMFMYNAANTFIMKRRVKFFPLEGITDHSFSNAVGFKVSFKVSPFPYILCGFRRSVEEVTLIK